MLRRSLLSGVLSALLVIGWVATPAAQGSFSAQIQAALQLFLQQAHTWTQTQTFQNIVVNGTCTGSGCSGGGGGTPGGASGTIQYNNSGSFGGFGEWTGSVLTLGATIHLGDVDTTEITQATPIDAPSGAGTLTPTLAGAGAGNVPNGTVSYKFTYWDGASLETLPSTETPSVTVVDNTVNGKVTVALPVTCYSLLPYIKIYRKDSTTSGAFKLAGNDGWSCKDNWLDNVASASLGANAPTTDASVQEWLQLSGGMIHAPLNAPSGYNTIMLGDRWSLLTIAQAPPGVAGYDVGILGGGASGADAGGAYIFGQTLYDATTGGLLADGSSVGVYGGKLTGAGGQVYLQGGRSRANNANGGDLFFYTGAGNGTGHAGDVVIHSRLVTIDNLTATGSATGKKVVCVDTATGALYASSTGTDCSN